MRLYKMEITQWPAEMIEHNRRLSNEDFSLYSGWKPLGWAKFVAQEIERGRSWSPDERFFWPSEDKLYRSRSSADDKAGIVRRWGGDAVVLEAEVGEFIPVTEANKRRKRTRNAARIARLAAQIKAIEGETA